MHCKKLSATPRRQFFATKNSMKTVLLTLAVTVGLLLIAVVAMGVKVLFVKNGRFALVHACGFDAARRRRAVRNQKKSNPEQTITEKP